MPSQGIVLDVDNQRTKSNFMLCTMYKFSIVIRHRSQSHLSDLSPPLTYFSIDGEIVNSRLTAMDSDGCQQPLSESTVVMVYGAKILCEAQDLMIVYCSQN